MTRIPTWMSTNLFERYHLIFYLLLLSSIGYIRFQYYSDLTLPDIRTVANNITSSKATTISYRPGSARATIDDQVSVYYRHATSARNSSYPYISGDTFRALADYIYDETRQDNLLSVTYGEVVFVKADMLSGFFDSPFNSIRAPFVLITHNSDYAAPVKYRSYLSNSKILMWYASNPSEKSLSRLTSVPIGLANTRWAQGNIDQITYALQHHRKPWTERTSLLYVNFSPQTNPAERGKALERASAIDNVQIIRTRISFQTYLEQIGNAKFVLSPPGNGLDCHRTWEALLMGAVPIVLTSGLDSLFANDTALIVDNWSNLTTDRLLSFNSSAVKQELPDVLSARYWRRILLSHRNSRPKTP